MALYLFKFEFIVCWWGGPGWGLALAPGHIFHCHITIVIFLARAHGYAFWFVFEFGSNGYQTNNLTLVMTTLALKV
jgi:hypothetical protein